MDEIIEYEKPVEKPKEQSRRFSKLLAACCGIFLILAGAAIGYNLHKILSSDNKTLISSQIADTDNLVADFSFSPALGKTATGRLCQFTVVPKVFVEDMTATFMIVPVSGESITKEATLGDGTAFSAVIEVPYYSFSVTVTFSDGYGKYTQGLMKNVNILGNGYTYESIWNNNGR
jgi:hypothetical protein